MDQDKRADDKRGGGVSEEKRAEIKAVVDKTLEDIKTSLAQHTADARAQALKALDAKLHERILELDPSYDPGAPPAPEQLPA